MSIIIYGPQGCGKIRNAEKLRKIFGMSEVVDDGHDPYPLSEAQVIEFKGGGNLFLTDINPESRGYNKHNGRVISYADAVRMSGGTPQ